MNLQYAISDALEEYNRSGQRKCPIRLSAPDRGILIAILTRAVLPFTGEIQDPAGLPTVEDEPTCKTCRLFQKVGEGKDCECSEYGTSIVGQCRKSAPTFTVSAKYMSGFPFVPETCWCGEYQPKTELAQ